MKKNLFLTSLLVLIATFGMAQKASWPITLTTADGLPGKQIVKNYYYKSQVFELDESVSKLRFTVISTNTVDSWTEKSYDGYGTGWGPGFPFFALGELAIYDAQGEKVEYTATCNAAAVGDGGGVAALYDGKPGTFLHTAYYKGDWPQAYHYVEVTLNKPVDSFSFSWYSRDNYFKNLITHLGITDGTEYFPYPEQEFQLGEQVTSLDELAEEGGLFVLRGNTPDFNHVSGTDVNRWYKGQAFYHSPYGAATTASAASLVCLTPDPSVENGYKVSWLNSGNYLIKPELNGSIGSYYYATKNELNAATIEFVAADDASEKAGTFKMFSSDRKYVVQQNPRIRMEIANYNDTVDGEYYWTIYKASISGKALAGDLQNAIDAANDYIAKYGNESEYDCGSIAFLNEKLAVANALASNPEASANNILAAIDDIDEALIAYILEVGAGFYADSVNYVSELVDNDEIKVSGEGENAIGAYSYASYQNMISTLDIIDIPVSSNLTLAYVEGLVEEVISAIDGFWASECKSITTLPLHVGTPDDGLPGTKESYGGYRWESPLYTLSEKVNAIRLTFFKTNNNGTYSGTSYVFPTFGEIEVYDAGGNKLALNSSNFYSNSVYMVENGTGDKVGYPALCDGDVNSHFHGVWGSGQNATYSANPTYSYLEITFPEPINSFKYVQYGRKNAVNTPTDFVIGKAGIDYAPEDVDYPNVYNVALGEKVTELSQITDDGLYAIVGLLNCDPNYGNSGDETYFSSMASAAKFGADCVFSIRKSAADEDTYYVQSLADGGYWKSTSDTDGWGNASPVYVKKDASKLNIVPSNNSGLPGSFVIYEYNESVYREITVDTTAVNTNVPYLIFQDWGNNVATFSVPSLDGNDKDGEGEWYIYKVTMDNPYIYWLKNAMATINAMGLKPGVDPGFYPEAVPGSFASAMAAAQAAIDAYDNTSALSALMNIESALDGLDLENANPIVPGFYVIETANANFLANQGISKAICTYFNDFESGSPLCVSEYSLWWADMPEDIENAPVSYKFQFIPASESDRVQGWLTAGKISAAEAANAYYIKSCEVGQYACAHDGQMYSQDVGLRVEQDQPYIVRSRGGGIFDLWNPAGGNSGYSSMHLEGNSGGKGSNGDIVYWSGNDAASQWYLRKTIMEQSVSIEVLNGTGTLSADKVEYGSPVTVQIAPANGDYKLKSFTMNGVDIKDSLVDNKFTVASVTANLKFKAEYYVTAGDANDDGDVTVTDVVAVVNRILDKVQDVFNLTAADINGDGVISIGDVVGVVKMILSPDDYSPAANAKRGVMEFGSESLVIEDVTSATGTAAVPVALNNSMEYTAFQMDVELPEGAEFVSATLGGRAAGHTAAWSKLPDGKVRVLAYSLSNATIEGNAGELVTFNVKADEAVSGSVAVDNVRVVTTDGVETAIGGCGSVIDINGTTGIASTDSDEFKVYTASGALVVESGKAMQISVYSLNGRLVETLNVTAGKNIFDALPAGTYVVGNSKVIIK